MESLVLCPFYCFFQLRIRYAHKQTSPELLAIWSTHRNNTASYIFHCDILVNSIATALFTICSPLTILLPYMITTLLHNILKIAHIETILWNVLTILLSNHHIVKQYCYYIC